MLTRGAARLPKDSLEALFKSTGDNLYIEPPFRTDYGCNTSIGENFYANYDCIIIDVVPSPSGETSSLRLESASIQPHMIDAAIRNSLLEFGKPVSIGDDVWVGGNVAIHPGVTIGSNVVIGSGSVVVKDIPDGVIAVGNPAEVLREITPDDHEKWKALAEQYRQETQPAEKGS